MELLLGVDLLSLSLCQGPGGGSPGGSRHRRMWLSEDQHGVEPVCLEGLGQPRAGGLLPVLRGVGSFRDRHEEKEVAAYWTVDVDVDATAALSSAVESKCLQRTETLTNVHPVHI